MPNANLNFAAVSGSALKVLDADPKRRYLEFWPDKAATVTLGTSPQVGLNNGPVISSTTGPLTLRYKDVGPLVTKPFWAIASGAGVIGIIEGQD